MMKINIDWNEWNNIVINFNVVDNLAESLNIYVNGIFLSDQICEFDEFNQFNEPPLFLIRVNDDSSPFMVWNGKIDQSSIWDISLTAEQVNELYNDEFLNDDSHLIALYHYNKGEDDIVYDYSGNKNHGSLYNATWSSEGFCPGNNFDDCGVYNGANVDLDCNGNCGGLSQLNECDTCYCPQSIIDEYGPGICIDTNFDNIPDTCEGGYYNGEEGDCDLCSQNGWTSQGISCGFGDVVNL